MTYIVLKLAIIGPVFSGKSNLCCAIVNREPKIEYVSTIGVDYMCNFSPDTKTKICVWDLSGLDRFSSICSPYIKQNDILLFCYNSEDISSFFRMVEKYQYYLYLIKNKNKYVIVVATKIDSQKSDRASKTWGQTFANNIGAEFVSVSSKTGVGMKELIEKAVEGYKIINNVEEPLEKESELKMLPRARRNICIIC